MFGCTVASDKCSAFKLLCIVEGNNGKTEGGKAKRMKGGTTDELR